MRTRQGLLDTAEVFLLDKLRLTTHHSRQCPFCHGKVYREKRFGYGRLAILLALRPYRCETCDRVHHGFSF